MKHVLDTYKTEVLSEKKNLPLKASRKSQERKRLLKSVHPVKYARSQ